MHSIIESCLAQVNNLINTRCKRRLWLACNSSRPNGVVPHVAATLREDVGSAYDILSSTVNACHAYVDTYIALDLNERMGLKGRKLNKH